MQTKAGVVPISHLFLCLCLGGLRFAPCQQSNFPSLLPSFISNCLPVCSHPLLRHFSPQPGYAASIQLFRWCKRLSAHSQKLSYCCVIVASDAGGGVVSGEESKKLVSRTERNKLCSTNTCCNKIQVIRLWGSVRVYLHCLWLCVCTWDECVCARMLMKGSIYCSCYRMFFPSCFSFPLFLDWWQWEEVRGQQYQCNTIHHTCQTARTAAGDKWQKFAFHPSPPPSIPACLSQPLSLYISIIAGLLINDSRSHIISSWVKVLLTGILRFVSQSRLVCLVTCRSSSIRLLSLSWVLKHRGMLLTIILVYIERGTFAKPMQIITIFGTSNNILYYIIT